MNKMFCNFTEKSLKHTTAVKVIYTTHKYRIFLVSTLILEVKFNFRGIDF